MLAIGRTGFVIPISRRTLSRRYCSCDAPYISAIRDLILKQQWSKLKLQFLRTTSPSDVLRRLLDSHIDSELTLRYFSWSEKEFGRSYSLDLTFRMLFSLLHEKNYPKIRSFLVKFVKRHGDYAVSSVFHLISICSNSPRDSSSVIADILVWAYVRTMRLDLGLEAFKRAKDYGFKLSVETCNLLLSVLTKNIEDVEFVYGEMIKRRIEVDVISFNIVISRLCEVGKLDKANDVLKDMKAMGVEPNRITYNNLIDGNCKMGKLGKMYKADAILKEMVATGIRPDVATLNILIDGFCNDDNMSVAIKFFKEMKREGMKQPSNSAFNSLINEMCAGGKVEEVTSLRNQMSSLGLRLNTVTYNTILTGLCRNKMVTEAVALFGEMEAQKVAANVITYNILIDAYCKLGKMEDAFSLHGSMLERGVSPSISTYNSLIAGLCGKPDWDAVKVLLDEMTSNNLPVNVVTYNIMIKSCCQRREARKGVKLLEEMVKRGLRPNHITYNTLMDGYCSEGNIRAALNLRTHMEKEGKRANVVTYNVLVKGLCKKGKLQDANGLLNEMLEKGLVPNEITYETIKEEMTEIGFHPDIEGHL